MKSFKKVFEDRPAFYRYLAELLQNVNIIKSFIEEKERYSKGAYFKRNEKSRKFGA